MKARANGTLNRAARFRAFALLAIGGVVLLCPGANWARSQDAAKPASAAKTTPAPKQSAAAKPPANGLHTGITVHGWWKIDVRNPDGKLVAHREFENNLITSGQGDAFLAGVLGRTNTVGPWQVFLITDAASSTPGNALSLNEPTYPNCSPVTGATASTIVGCGLAASVTGQYGNSLVLSGTITESSSFTGTKITQVQSANGNQMGTFTAAPTSVPLGPGQFVTVSVTFSFQ